jgi:uncharacterized membrane protein YgcG
MTRTVVTLALTILFGGAAMAGASPGQAAASPKQTAASQSHWNLWAGCWTLAEETSDDGSATIARLLGLPAPRTRGLGAGRVCVTLDPPGAATLATTMADRPAMTETIVADGTQRALTDSECRGWQRAEWSALGPRLFASAEMTCGDQARKVSGLSMMIAGPTWIDIQMIESGSQRNLRVRRYRRAADDESARRTTGRAPALASRLTFNEVKEASGKVAPEAVQALLLELKGGFDLNGKKLVELADAGVARGVIDLMVALSFPQRFVVDRPVSSGVGAGSWSFDAFDQSWPYYASPYLFTSYYAPFGYRYWGGYDNYYFNGPGFVVINPNPGQVPLQPSGDGRVVDGRGYTRVRRVEPESSTAAGSYSAFGGSSTAGSSGGSSSSGTSGVSSSGYSSGGGGGGGGERTAQPRPPGR